MSSYGVEVTWRTAATARSEVDAALELEPDVFDHCWYDRPDGGETIETSFDVVADSFEHARVVALERSAAITAAGEVTHVFVTDDLAWQEWHEVDPPEVPPSMRHLQD